MEISRLEIKTIDRPNMTHDISGVFVKYKVDIIWMEIYTYIVYVKFKKLDSKMRTAIIKEISEICGVQSLNEVNLISVEEKEIEIKTVMDAVWQGVIVLNKDEKIKYINKYALKDIFFINEEDAINRDISSLLEKDYKKVKKMLKTAENSNEVEDLEIQLSNKEFLLSISTMLSEKNILLGFVIILQDVKRMDKLLNIKRYDNQITFNDIIGKSQKFNESISNAKVFSQSDSPVLIMGKSGTGKELFARAIHNLSSRSALPFVAVNCGAIPDQLLESELFGYEGGSFTGAKNSGKIGLFEIANGGTIFLDEIGEMQPHLQVKLLRVLQEKKLRKLGSNDEQEIDIRIISATNKNLSTMVESNQFRLDLFYRINIFTLTIPPLRERSEDIAVFIDYYTKQFSKKYNKEIDGIEPGAMQKLLNYEWYGNVRELQNVMERTVALNYTGTIKEKDLILSKPTKKELANTSSSLKETLAGVEKEMIIEALKSHKSIRECARSLGVTHTLLINRMKKYSIYNNEWRNSK